MVMRAGGFVAGCLAGRRIQGWRAKAKPTPAFPAVPGQKGGEDISGPYEPVADWPKPLTSLPGHENWTWGAVEGIYAESPDRVFIAQRGELPAVKRPVNTPIPASGPSRWCPTATRPCPNQPQCP